MNLKTELEKVLNYPTAWDIKSRKKLVDQILKLFREELDEVLRRSKLPIEDLDKAREEILSRI